MQMLEAIARLRDLAPNTALNSRCPWKGDKRVTRLWCPCPVHERAWVRLLVGSNELGEAQMQCAAGCAQEEVEMAIFDAGARRQNWRQRPLDDRVEYLM